MVRKRISLSSPSAIAMLLWPMLLYPLALFPYIKWGITPFAELVRFFVIGESTNPMWVLFNASKTVVFFWGALSVVVILICAIIALLRVRPWYFIPLYLIVAAGCCGIFSYIFYTIMLRYYGFG